MDQAMMAYFDERFRETTQVMTQQVSLKIEELRDQVDAQFKEVYRQLGEVREEARDANRHTLVLLEDVRHQVQLLAEGYRSVDDRLARFEGDREQYACSIHRDDPVKDLDNRVGILEGWVERHREVVGESIRKLAAGPSSPGR